MAFTFEKTKLPGVVIIQPQVFGDSRGYFMESFKAPDFAKACDIGATHHYGNITTLV